MNTPLLEMLCQIEKYQCCIQKHLEIALYSVQYASPAPLPIISVEVFFQHEFRNLIKLCDKVLCTANCYQVYFVSFLEIFRLFQHDILILFCVDATDFVPSTDFINKLLLFALSVKSIMFPMSGFQLTGL